MPECCRVAA